MDGSSLEKELQSILNLSASSRLTCIPEVSRQTAGDSGDHVVGRAAQACPANNLTTVIVPSNAVPSELRSVKSIEQFEAELNSGRFAKEAFPQPSRSEVLIDRKIHILDRRTKTTAARFDRRQLSDPGPSKRKGGGIDKLSRIATAGRAGRVGPQRPLVCNVRSGPCESGLEVSIRMSTPGPGSLS